MARRKSPKVYVAALAVASLAAVAYKVYDMLGEKETAEDESEVETSSGVKIANPNRSVAVTLSHSILSSNLPLSDILLSAHNVTFILPPHLSMDDLEQRIELEDPGSLPQPITNNYKLLRCSNIEGYFSIVKNLRPDKLFVCSQDLGIAESAPKDLSRFVKEIVTLDQNGDHVYSVLSKVFLR